MPKHAPVALRALLRYTLVGTLLLASGAVSHADEAARDAQIEALSKQLRGARTPPATLVQTLNEVGPMLRLPMPAGLDAARRAQVRLARVEALLLKALARKQVPRGTKRNTAHPVQIAAAVHLRHARPATLQAMMKVLHRKVLRDSDYVRLPVFYMQAFETLAASGHPEAFGFILSRGIVADPDPESRKCALAAMRTLQSMSLHGTERRAAVRRMIDIFQSYTFHWPNTYDVVAGFRTPNRRLAKVLGSQSPYWMEVRPVLLRTLTDLSVDPQTGRPPVRRGTTRTLDTVPHYLNWFQKVQRKASRPWITPRVPAAEVAADRYVPPFATTYIRKYGVPWQVWWQLHRRPWSPAEAPTSDAQASTPDWRAKVAGYRAAMHEMLRPWLHKHLGDAAPRVRASALVALAKLPGGASDDVLKAADKDPAPRVREAALLARLHGGMAAYIPGLRAILGRESASARERGLACLALGACGDGAWIHEQIFTPKGALAPGRAPDDLAACALHALALAEHHAAADDVLGLLRARRVPLAVRGHAGRVLAVLGSAEHVHSLQHLLAHPARDDEEAQVVGAAVAVALAAHVPLEDRGALRSALRPIVGAKGQAGGVRNQLAVSLGRRGGARITEALVAAFDVCLRDTQRFAERGHLLLALGLTGSEPARALLARQLRTLDHEHDLGAASVASALHPMADERSLIRGRVLGSMRQLTAPGLATLGLDDDLALPGVLAPLTEGREDPAVLADAGLALARTAGPGSLGRLRQLWVRTRDPLAQDLLGWAFCHAAAPATTAWLQIEAGRTDTTPYARALTVTVLGRMADVRADPVLMQFRARTNPYVEGAPTLRALAQYGDTAPLFPAR